MYGEVHLMHDVHGMGVDCTRYLYIDESWLLQGIV